MRLEELPLRLMNVYFCVPRQDALDFLASLWIPQYIMRKYSSPEDRADAFEGAFTGFHVQAHLSKGGDKITWFKEVFEWYDFLDKDNLDGPFYDGLKTTLNTCGFEDFYNEAIDFIIEQSKSLEREKRKK